MGSIVLGNHEKFQGLAHRIFSIFKDFYPHLTEVDYGQFLLPPAEDLKNCGRTLVLEDADSLQIGMQFGCQLNFAPLQPHALTVVAEELSHFHLLIEAAEGSHQLTQRDLETQGEIDRFLILLFWNQKNQDLLLSESWKNIHALCDYVFQGNRFPEDVSHIYFAAEALAFKHLKQAFAAQWDNSHLDLSQLNAAKKYLNTLRSSFFKSGYIKSAG